MSQLFNSETLLGLRHRVVIASGVPGAAGIEFELPALDDAAEVDLTARLGPVAAPRAAAPFMQQPYEHRHGPLPVRPKKQRAGAISPERLRSILRQALVED